MGILAIYSDILKIRESAGLLILYQITTLNAESNIYFLANPYQLNYSATVIGKIVLIARPSIKSHCCFIANLQTSGDGGVNKQSTVLSLL